MSRRSSPRPSSMGRRACKTADDRDVHTRWYRVMTSYSRSGARSRAKRATRRRERREAQRDVQTATREVSS